MTPQINNKQTITIYQWDIYKQYRMIGIPFISITSILSEED